jgi:hypothetical protein
MNRPSTEEQAGPSGGSLIWVSVGGGLFIVGLLAFIFGGWFVALAVWFIALLVVPRLRCAQIPRNVLARHFAPDGVVACGSRVCARGVLGLCNAVGADGP